MRNGHSLKSLDCIKSTESSKKLTYNIDTLIKLIRNNNDMLIKLLRASDSHESFWDASPLVFRENFCISHLRHP